MVKDKMFINLAEKFFNLKSEMNVLTRTVKEKENKLLLEEAKAVAAKPEVKKEETPSVVSTPKVEVSPKVAPVKAQEKPQQKPQQRPQNNERRFNQDGANNQRYNQNRRRALY